MSIPVLSSPIVLAHGLLGFSRLEVGGITVASYFNRIPDILTAAGNTVVQTQVPPTGSIAARAEALRDEIARHCGTKPVHIIAHSMGGLDARHMITHLDMAGRVLSLTTLGTPHRGTVLADRGVAYAPTRTILNTLRALGMPDEAFHDLRVDQCSTFNLVTPDADGVQYFSAAGACPREAMPYLLRPCHDVIAPQEGPNDGLVSVASATWGESLTLWDCDHVAMVGWTTPWRQMTGQSFDVEPAYTAVLERLQSCGF